MMTLGNNNNHINMGDTMVVLHREDTLTVVPLMESTALLIIPTNQIHNIPQMVIVAALLIIDPLLVGDPTKSVVVVDCTAHPITDDQITLGPSHTPTLLPLSVGWLVVVEGELLTLLVAVVLIIGLTLLLVLALQIQLVLIEVETDTVGKDIRGNLSPE